MSRAPKEEAAEKEWRKATDEHAAKALWRAIDCVHRPDPAPCSMVRNADDNGGHVVEIRGPDGEWRRYYVRLTEVRA